MNPETLVTEIPKQEKKDYSEDQFYYEMVGIIDKHWRNFDNLQSEKHRFIEEYQERAEEIEIFFDFPEYCQIQQEIRNKKRWKKEEVPMKFKSLAEWHFLVTNYLLHNYRDEEGSREFWKATRFISRNFRDGEQQWAMSRSGMTMQVCVHNLLERLNLHPKLSMPEDDYLSGEDLCGWNEEGKEMFFQTKTGKQIKELSIDKIGYLTYPVSSSGKIRMVGNEMNKINSFKGTLEELKEKLEEGLISLEVCVPRDEKYYNKDTGMPTEVCIKEFQEKIKQYQ